MLTLVTSMLLVMKLMKSHLLVSVFVLGVSGCGGGSTDLNGFDESLNGPKQGFITIEERANKRVVDAWFSQGVVPQSNVIALWNEGAERCVESQAASFSENNRASQVGTRWRDTLFAGDFISIESRSGEISRLLAQRFGEAVLYASAERWIAAPLPDDAQIMLTGSDEFPAFDPIPISPLTRLVRTAPTDGVTRDLSTAISWEASEATDDAIELVVSASDSTEQSTKSVKCWLNDNGQFVLPDVVRQVLPQNRQAVISLARTRSSSYDSGNAQLHVRQSSYP